MNTGTSGRMCKSGAGKEDTGMMRVIRLAGGHTRHLT